MEGKIDIAKGEASQVVKAHDMVHVGVGVEDGVDPPDVLSQALGPEIWAGIDDPAAGVRFDVD